MTVEPVKPPVEDVNLSAIAAEIARMNGRRIVAIDGVDGAGKTTFADKLAPLVAANGKPALTVFTTPAPCGTKREKTTRLAIS